LILFNVSIPFQKSDEKSKVIGEVLPKYLLCFS
jgi:hypothetical protein